jgi:hypothetical protein
MLKSFRISSGDLPLIMLATVLHPTSLLVSSGSAQSVYSLQERLDIEVAVISFITSLRERSSLGGENDLEQHLLINLDESTISHCLYKGDMTHLESHSPISEVFLLESSVSVVSAAGESALWCSHHSRILERTDEETLGRSMG